MAITPELIAKVRKGTPEQQNKWLKLMKADYDKLDADDKATLDYVKNKLRPEPTDDTPEFLSEGGLVDKASHVLRGVIAVDDEEKARALVKTIPELHSPSKIDGRWYVYEMQDDGTSKPIAINKKGLSWQDAASWGAELATFIPALRAGRAIRALNVARRAANIEKQGLQLARSQNRKMHMDSPTIEDSFTGFKKSMQDIGNATALLGSASPGIVGNLGRGALMGAGVDLSRQGVSNVLGYRDDLDTGRILGTGLGTGIGRFTTGLSPFLPNTKYWKNMNSGDIIENSKYGSKLLPNIMGFREGLNKQLVPMGYRPDYKSGRKKRGRPYIKGYNISNLLDPFANKPDFITGGLGTLGRNVGTGVYDDDKPDWE